MNSVSVPIPDMGESVTEASLVRWLKRSGEVVALDAGNLAPAAASAGDFTRGMLSEGVTSMGIPGTMAGYWMIVERYGR